MADDSNRKEAQAPVQKSGTAVLPQPTKPRLLPPFKVILHNDDHNTVDHVIETIFLLTPLSEKEAVARTLEAHHSGCAVLLVTHQERAELYVEQFQSRGLTATTERDE